MRELSLNVMDIAQNSITAKASLVTIKICQSYIKNDMTISIFDNGKGMSKEQVENVIDPFFTTRTTRKVGLGVPLFKMAAEQTGGHFEIKSEIGKGTELSAYFKTDSIDMTPLGDINSTVCMLIRCNPDIDFVFIYQTEKGTLNLDTRQLREILTSEVPLDSPDVCEWIERFLEEQTQNIMEVQ